MIEISVRFFESFAMTGIYASCHCEKRSDEAISNFPIELKASYLLSTTGAVCSGLVTPGGNSIILILRK